VNIHANYASHALNLAAARLRHVAGKRYLNIALLKDHQITGAITA
jgi:hypothetical protein